MKSMVLSMVSSLALGFLAVNVCAVETETPQAPEKVQKTDVTESNLGKVVWDIDLRTSPQQFNVFIKAIRQTYDDLVKAQVKPDMVLVFRSLGASLSKRNSGSAWGPKIQKENVRLVGELQELPGVRMEADRQAISSASDEAKKLLPKVRAVDNVFITLMKHQAAGYHIITID